jgi:prepilin-type N-terminal cleavage/methylation domain-containing protein
MKEEQGLGLSQKGFTIIELMVALVLSFILIGAVYGTFTSQQKAYTVQDQVAEMQQNARMAMNILVRDIRMAGYGMPDTGVSSPSIPSPSWGPSGLPADISTGPYPSGRRKYS